jgi:hypothetical protein
MSNSDLQNLVEAIASLSAEDRANLWEVLEEKQLTKSKDEPTEKAFVFPEYKVEAGNARIDFFEVKNKGNFWGDKGRASYQVLIKKEGGDRFSATLLGWPNCQGVGKTRSRAISNLQELVNSQLAEAEIATVELKSNLSDSPWVRLAGKYENDPQYDEVLAYIEEYRRELDAETEEYYRKLEEEEKANEPIHS